MDFLGLAPAKGIRRIDFYKASINPLRLRLAEVVAIPASARIIIYQLAPSVVYAEAYQAIGIWADENRIKEIILIIPVGAECRGYHKGDVVVADLSSIKINGHCHYAVTA